MTTFSPTNEALSAKHLTHPLFLIADLTLLGQRITKICRVLPQRDVNVHSGFEKIQIKHNSNYHILTRIWGSGRCSGGCTSFWGCNTEN